MLEPKWLLSLGYAFPCSLCLHMTLPEGKQAPRCYEETCGGPFAGRSFPAYMGPLTRASLAKHCFRCGEDASEAIVAKDGGYVGVCEKHLNSTIETSSDTLVPTKGHP